ncbi:hypothetical protein HK100_004267 [Physocladia obscura]|uniref:RING-type domain-containing protein n=1 Tax=Physocladia obscura TaxID=109957 RepID=A0AAD5ST01_9FUNG|nr:hypothetical protein HK100_004267 [Physocladia obscura]
MGRNYSWGIGLVALVVVAVFASLKWNESTNENARKFKQLPGVLLMGDSITELGFKNEWAGWAARLSEYMQGQRDVFNRGYSGYTTRNYAPMFSDLLQGVGEVALTTLYLGANDAIIPDSLNLNMLDNSSKSGPVADDYVFGGIPITEFAVALRAIVATHRQVNPSGRLLLIAPPPPVCACEFPTAGGLVSGWRGLAYSDAVGATATAPTLRPTDRRHNYTRLYRDVVIDVVRTENDSRVGLMDPWEMMFGPSAIYNTYTADSFLSDGLHYNEMGDYAHFDYLVRRVKILWPELEETCSAIMQLDKIRLDMELDYQERLVFEQELQMQLIIEQQIEANRPHTDVNNIGSSAALRETTKTNVKVKGAKIVKQPVAIVPKLKQSLADRLVVGRVRLCKIKTHQPIRIANFEGSLLKTLLSSDGIFMEECEQFFRRGAYQGWTLVPHPQQQQQYQKQEEQQKDPSKFRKSHVHLVLKVYCLKADLDSSEIVGDSGDYFIQEYRKHGILEVYAVSSLNELESRADAKINLTEMAIPNTFDIAAAEQPPAPFLLNLYVYQLRTLAWMHGIEDSEDWCFYSPRAFKITDDKFFVSKTILSSDNGICGEFETTDSARYFCPSLRSGIIADKPGVGKTIATLALCSTRPCTDPEYLYKIKNNRLRSRATAIFVPNNVCAQWILETQKCFGPKNKSIKIIEIKGKRQFEATTLKDILECDIVVISNNFFSNQNYFGFKVENRKLESCAPAGMLPTAKNNGATGDNDDDKGESEDDEMVSEKQQQKQQAVTSKFVKSLGKKAGVGGRYAFTWIHFHRIVYDELHEIGDKPNGIKLHFPLMSADALWGLTGTPKIEASTTIAKFARVLKVGLFENDDESAHQVMRRRGMTYSYPSIMRMEQSRDVVAKQFVANRMRRNEPDVAYPTPMYETIMVVPTALEYSLYRSSIGQADVESLIKLQNARLEDIEVMEGYISSQEALVMDFEKRLKPLTAKSEIEILTERLKAAKAKSEKLKRDLKAMQSQFTFFKNFLATYTTGEADITCSVCLENISKSNLALLPCGHVLCLECAGEVARKNGHCPECRFAVAVNQLIELHPPAPKLLAPEIESCESDEDKLDPDKFGSKIRELVKYLQIEMARDVNFRFIVFIQFSDLADLVSKALNTFGIGTARLKSGWPQRENALKKFRSGLPGAKSCNSREAVKVLMLSAKDSVSGLNLIEATHCIILHPFHAEKEEYAIAAEKQGVARTLRNGQTKTVKIVRFVVEKTVEQEIHNSRIKKLVLNDV